jgi:hypothetical protein
MKHMRRLWSRAKDMLQHVRTKMNACMTVYASQAAGEASLERESS